MKKIIIWLSVLCVVSGVSARESIDDILRNVKYGVETGLALSTLQGLSGQTHTVGGVIGGTASYRYSPYGHLDTFFGVVQRGSDGDAGAVTLTYVYLPVTLRYLLPGESRYRPCVYIGAYGAYLLSAKSDGDDVDSGFQDNDYGWLYGVGMGIPINNTILNVTLGYETGFKNVTTTRGDEGYNRSLVLKGGLRF